MLGAQQMAVEAQWAALASIPCGVVAVTLTPAGGSPRSASAVRFVNEEPSRDVQGRAATFAFLRSDVPEDIPDGSTVDDGTDAWTSRTERVDCAFRIVEAWA